MEAIKPLAKATARPGSDAGLGGFGALFDLKAAGYKDPILVATTDGVGTKLKLAIASGRHETVGTDLVAMCVNDLVVQGAEPLFFLDYFAAGKLELSAARVIVAGIAAACRAAGCALVGGETAEMPGLYAHGDYDLAGFAVGAVERAGVIDGRTVKPGDLVLGLASSGLHSNGFSLVRRVVEASGLALDAPAPFAPGGTLAQALLVPTRLYVKSCLAAIAAGRAAGSASAAGRAALRPALRGSASAASRRSKASPDGVGTSSACARAGGVKALAHITGGGLIENIPRVIPGSVSVELDARAWPLPPVFRWLAETAGLARQEMARVFNCGLGMVAVVDPARVDVVERALAGAGETVYRVGRVVPRPQDGAGTLILHWESQWPG